MSPSVEPFNEAKYKALMDGLEATEISLTTIKATTYDFRIESEFYKKTYIEILKHLKSIDSKELKKDFSAVVTDGTHYTPNYVDEGVAFLSALNVQDNFFDVDAGYKYISVEQHRELCRRVLPQAGDVLLRKVGVGPRKACVVPQNAFEFSIFVSVALIRSQIDPYYLSTFINSKYGQIQLLRFNKGISQPDLHLEDINIMLVPEFSSNFYNSIRTLVLSSEQSRVQSRICYSSAEAILDLTFNKNALENQKTFVAIKSFTESFSVSGRLDAEYYQPKYDELFASLKKHTTQLLGGKDGIVIIKKSIEPGSDSYCDEGIPFVRVSDVTKYGISEPSIKLARNIIAEPNKLYPKKNTILFSKDGSVGIAYKMEKDTEVITSGAWLHLTVKNPLEILPDYLTLVLNSPIVQLQAERDSNGAIIQHWKPSEIENVIIPILDKKTQQEIASKVQDSFALRRKSEQLLENAKQAVELAIEQGEDKAMKWLKGKNVEV